MLSDKEDIAKDIARDFKLNGKILNISSQNSKIEIAIHFYLETF